MDPGSVRLLWVQSVLARTICVTDSDRTYDVPTHTISAGSRDDCKLSQDPIDRFKAALVVATSCWLRDLINCSDGRPNEHTALPMIRSNQSNGQT
uniref:Putative secreted protein n=1 Tax=Anopheles darlingi TaxID=43151 RepID=A0A2M4D8Q2_ANODA